MAEPLVLFGATLLGAAAAIMGVVVQACLEAGRDAIEPAQPIEGQHWHVPGLGLALVTRTDPGGHVYYRRVLPTGDLGLPTYDASARDFLGAGAKLVTTPVDDALELVAEVEEVLRG